MRNAAPFSSSRTAAAGLRLPSPPHPRPPPPPPTPCLRLGLARDFAPPPSALPSHPGDPTGGIPVGDVARSALRGRRSPRSSPPPPARSRCEQGGGGPPARRIWRRRWRRRDRGGGRRPESREEGPLLRRALHPLPSGGAPSPAELEGGGATRRKEGEGRSKEGQICAGDGRIRPLLPRCAALRRRGGAGGGAGRRRGREGGRRRSGSRAGGGGPHSGRICPGGRAPRRSLGPPRPRAQAAREVARQRRPELRESREGGGVIQSGAA